MKLSPVTIIGLLLSSSPSCIFGGKDQDSEGSVDTFHSLVTLLDEGDKNFIQTHLAELPSSEIHSMEQELIGMSKSDMEDVLHEMLLDGKEDVNGWPSFSCKKNKNNCQKCSKSCSCKSGRCSWKYICTDKNDNGFNGCACIFDHDCQTGRCAANFKCGDKLSFGARCGEDDDCKSGVCSWGFKCVSKGTNGGFCIEDDDCNSGRCSKAFKCASKLSNGNFCGEDDDCNSGKCSWGLRCVDKGQNGGYCVEDEDCNSGRCSKLFKCADKLNEYEVCWKGGNDCKDGSKCLAPLKFGTGVCMREKSMSCYEKAKNSFTSPFVVAATAILSGIPKASSQDAANQIIAKTSEEFLKANKSEYIDAYKVYTDCAGVKNFHQQNELVSVDSDVEEMAILPSFVLMGTFEGNTGTAGMEIELGYVFSKWGRTLVVDVCANVGPMLGMSFGFEVGVGFFETKQDVGGFTNCFATDINFYVGGGGYLCSSFINILFGLGKSNWEVGLAFAVLATPGGGLNAGGCFSHKIWESYDDDATAKNLVLNSDKKHYTDKKLK